MKTKTQAIITETEILAEDIYSMTLKAPGIASDAVPGQFISVFCRDRAHLLPRPISICDIDSDAGTLRLVYRVAGYGTGEMAKLMPNSIVNIMGPLGNGFPIDKNKKSVMLIGGGIGIPPMLCLAKELKKQGNINIISVTGYRDRHTFLMDELRLVSDSVVIATDDGSIGTYGTVIDAINNNKINGDIIYACGPMPMLRAVKALAQERKIPAYVSLEEKMACGVGACLGCVCTTTDTDEHSKVNNARICADGPVFDSYKIIL